MSDDKHKTFIFITKGPDFLRYDMAVLKKWVECNNNFLGYQTLNIGSIS